MLILVREEQTHSKRAINVKENLQKLWTTIFLLHIQLCPCLSCVLIFIWCWNYSFQLLLVLFHFSYFLFLRLKRISRHGQRALHFTCYVLHWAEKIVNRDVFSPYYSSLSVLFGVFYFRYFYYFVSVLFRSIKRTWIGMLFSKYRSFSLAWPEAMLVQWNKRTYFRKNRVQFPEG